MSNRFKDSEAGGFIKTKKQRFDDYDGRSKGGSKKNKKPHKTDKRDWDQER